MLLLIGAFVGAGYWFSTPEKMDPGPLGEMRARYAGLVLEVVESKVVTVGGMDRFEVTLAPIRGAARSVDAAELLVGICGSILSARNALESRGFARERVFQVAVQVLKEGEDVFEAPIPISVRDKECRPDVWNGQYYVRYPSPIDDYVFWSVSASEQGEVTAKFRFLTNESRDLADFDFLAACRYLMQDPPPIWETVVPEPPERIVIVAERAFGNSIVGASWKRGYKFLLSGRECVVGSGEPV